MPRVTQTNPKRSKSWLCEVQIPAGGPISEGRDKKEETTASVGPGILHSLLKKIQVNLSGGILPSSFFIIIFFFKKNYVIAASETCRSRIIVQELWTSS